MSLEVLGFWLGACDFRFSVFIHEDDWASTQHKNLRLYTICDIHKIVLVFI